MNRVEVDVCIIGAGFAGLAAARKLMQSNKSIIVLEARSRVGGRVFSYILPDGTIINRGGTWLGAGHDRMYAVVKELGIETHQQFVDGNNIMVINGKTYCYRGLFPRMNPLVLIDFGLAIKKIDQMAKEVPLDAPWKARKAQIWDSQTIANWIDSGWHVYTKSARKMLHSLFTEFFMSHPAEVSLLHGLHLIHSLNNIEWAASAVGGAQQDLIVGGMQSVADRLASSLGEGVVQLNTIVKRIEQDSNDVLVMGDNLCVKARQIICAIPPILASRLKFDPPLPLVKSQLLDRSPTGQGIKWHAVYPEPFWRKNGFTGQVANMDELPPQLCIDCTPKAGKPGMLAGFAFGPPARKLATFSKEQRREVWLNGLVKYFGSEAVNPIAIDEQDWSTEEWTHGDMFAHYAPGVLTGFGEALREPCGRIHWAGTETAMEWNGSIEGAFRSGERAADEILQAVNP